MACLSNYPDFHYNLQIGERAVKEKQLITTHDLFPLFPIFLLQMNYLKYCSLKIFWGRQQENTDSQYVSFQENS